MPSKKKIAYFPRFIEAVPMMGPGFLQQIFLKDSLYRVLLIGQYSWLEYQEV